MLKKVCYFMADYWKKAGNAQASILAILFILFAVFVVVYIYMLPVQEKCKVFPDLKECSEGGAAGGVNETLNEVTEPVTLLFESPGYLKPEEKSAVYILNPVDIYNYEGLEIASILKKIELSSSWFLMGEEKGVFTKHERAKEIKLFIYVDKAEGKLKVNINPRLIYILEGSGLHQLSLPTSLLEKTNIVRFSVLTPTFPWKTSKYEIEKVLIKESYRLTDNAVSRGFNVTGDIRELKKAEVSFTADCLTKEALQIDLNNKPLERDTICSAFTVDATDAVSNINQLVFSSDGNYYVDPIKVSLEFNEKNYPTYYFDVDNYDEVKKNTRLFMLNLNFESTEEKEFEVYINGEALEVQTNNLEYNTRINDYLKRGSNSITIIPRTSVKVKTIELVEE